MPSTQPKATSDRQSSTVLPSSAVANDSMRRFSLLHRKSSNYSSSSISGDSSAKSASTSSHGNTSTSSRSSVSDSSRRRPSLVSFGSRLSRSQSKPSVDKQTTPSSTSQNADKRYGCRGDYFDQAVYLHNFSASTFGELFIELPAEIQTQILAHLTTSELLDLRSVSKHSLAIFHSNAVAITRNLFLQRQSDNSDSRNYSSALLIHQFPSIFSSTANDAFFLRSLRRAALARRQLKVLITWIQTRTYMLRLTRDLESENFASYRKRLTPRFYQPVLLLQHLLETIRHLIVFSHPNHESASPTTIKHCRNCNAQLKSAISSYPEHQLLLLFHTIQLLTQHFRNAMRSPTNVTIFERKLKGWDYGPPPEAHVSQLFFLGGLQELSKIDEMHGSYTKRLFIIRDFSDRVAKATKINSLAIPDFYQTQTDPVMAMAMAGADSSKSKSSKSKNKSKENDSTFLQTSNTMVSKQVRRDKDDVRTAIEARADEVPVTRSLDVRLDLLDMQTLASIPTVDDWLLNHKGLLATRILELKIVESAADLDNPYDYLTKMLAECYEPDI